MFKKLLFISILTLLLLPSFAFAVPGLPIVTCGTSTAADCTRCDLFKLLKNLIDFTVGVLMPAVAILLFVWAGFLILLGGANTNLVTQGRQIFSTTFFGIIIMLSAWMITNTLIKSIGSNYDKADTWWEFECVESAPVSPPTFKYSCNQNNQCVVDLNGTYTTSNCDNKCQAGATLSITTNNLPNGTLNQSYNQTIQVSGGTAPYAWTQLGSLPAGLSFNTATGVILGTPTTTGTSNFTIRITDNSSPVQSVERQFSIVVTSTTELVCRFTGVNLCQASNRTPYNNQTMVCGASACGQYVSAINQYASRTGVANGANFLKAIMIKESACDAQADSGHAYGLMQFKPDTAIQYASRCGIQNPRQTITPQWLKDNPDLSVCLAAEFIKAISQSQCGSSIRGIAAGYNGGQAGNTSACAPSVDCAGETNCAGGPVQRWECLYDDPQHTVCNDSRPSNYDETRDYAIKVLYCYNNPGF
ncbi:MAG: transglycosylase SLT domain-containing protein [Candidatus Yanofskybacteria bacterium]|nr:transglycosylase SLT domain-containing protein [Candidatus Yanofskybacteria bacterium]